MELKKHIAHRLKGSFGYSLECKCTDTIVCSNCVQANLLAGGSEFRQADEKQMDLIEKIEQVGVRKSARLLGVNPNAVHKWIKSKEAPNWVALKFDFGKGTDHEKS